MTLVPGDPLAHRALESLLRAEASVRRRLSADLERGGPQRDRLQRARGAHDRGRRARAAGAAAHRLRTSKANATEVVDTLEARDLVARRRLPSDRRMAAVALTARGEELVDRLFPEHARRVAGAFAVLEEHEKRTLAELCRKLAA